MVAVLPGDFGKARPALIVQSDAFNAIHQSIVLCPITSHLVEAPLFRLLLKPSAGNGLDTESQVMIDKMMAVKRERIAKVIGRADARHMHAVDQALRIWLQVG